MITLESNSSLNTFGVMTFTIYDYLLETEFKKKSEGLFNNIKYNELKSKFKFDLENISDVIETLDLENVIFFIGLIDFVSKLFLSDKSAYLISFFAEKEGATLDEFELSIIDYLKISTEFFIYFKDKFKDEEELLNIVNDYLNWSQKSHHA